MSSDFYVRRQSDGPGSDFAIRIFGSEYLMRMEEFEEFAEAVIGVRDGKPAIEGGDYQELRTHGRELKSPKITGAELLTMLALSEPIKRRKL